MEQAELAHLVDTGVLPAGTALLGGSEPAEKVANPWAAWAADLPDGRVGLGVLREQVDE